MKKIFAAAIALLFILQILIACGGDGKNTADTSRGGISGNEETEEITDPNARINKKDNLPADLNFDGKEIRILKRTSNATDFPDTSNGEVVNDAVYEKNLRVQERLNVKFSYGVLPRGDEWDGSLQDLRNMFMAGDDVYDLVCMTLNICTYGSLMTVYFMDVQGMPYLDFEQPWWNTNTIYELSHDGKTINYLVGEGSVSSIEYITCVFYNKNMYNDLYGDPDELYGITLDHKWTLDYYSAKCKDMYADLNGDGTTDADDQYGMSFDVWTYNEILVGFTDARMSSRDSDGLIQLDMDLPRLVTFAEKMYDLTYNNIGVKYYPSNAPSLVELFMNRKMAYYPALLTYSISFRGMEDDYGILPLPKLDEQQKEYRSFVTEHVVVSCIPKPCKIPETVCAVMEALAAEGYRSVTEIYYDVALKTKYSRDEYSGQVIDLLHATSYNSFLHTYIAHTSRSAFIICDLVGLDKSADLMSYYTKNESKYRTSLEKLIDTLSSNET